MKFIFRLLLNWRFLSVLIHFFIFETNLISKSFSQINKDTIHLSEIIVFNKKPYDLTGLKSTKIDSLILSEKQNSALPQLISGFTSVFNRIYSAGGIATTSFRGAGASHTQVIWNGFTLNSPMLGQADLNLIPVFLTDEIIVYHGGSALPNNSGALGGSIWLVSNADWRKNVSISLQQTVASFGTYNSQISLLSGNKKLQTKTKFFYQISGNNFNYEETTNSDSVINKTYKNANYEVYGLTEDVFWKLNEKNQIIARLWYQNKFQNLPVYDSYDTQKEDFIRTSLELNGNFNKLAYSLRTSFINDYMHYKQRSFPGNSLNTFNTFSNYADVNYNPDENVSILFGVNSDVQKVETSNYDDNKTRNDFSYYTGVKLFNSKINTTILLKQLVSDNKILPLIPSIGVDYKPFTNILIVFKANISRNYHLPNMNDLYWKFDGFSIGNEDLKSEKGFSGETGIKYSQKISQVSINTEFTGFYSLIDRWIIWTPNDDFIWTPKNLKKVSRQGFEIHFDCDYQFSKYSLSYNFNYSLVSAKNERAITENDETVEKQLVYVPKHVTNSYLRFSFSNFYISLESYFTSKRFTNEANTESLPSYSIINFNVGKSIKLEHTTLSLQASIDNLFDKQYQETKSFPQPGRNFQVSVKFGFSK